MLGGAAMFAMVNRTLPIAAAILLLTACQPTVSNATACELAARPSEFNGRVVRLTANAAFSMHGAFITDQRCIHVTIGWSETEKFRTTTRWRQLVVAVAQEQGIRGLGRDFSVDVTGVFHWNEGGHPRASLDVQELNTFSVMAGHLSE